MKKLPVMITAIALLVSISPGFAANNTAAPGQDRTCLVTTGAPNSWNDVDIVNGKWLPRKAADAQAAKDPSTMKTFDYANDPLVTGGTNASAQELCEKYFPVK